ncbi:pseudouridylate synthase TRUB1-like [Neocloeon triangulifer]|uniref:pseudouridylate synthase TRUB1-like n=1 Tax=Neocloeon triangulifer TaxID=2078957 RepID=UPI00286F7460|nr:pseudouridylate synthase TRUB1-like [Neocloeon triangulifer]
MEKLSRKLLTKGIFAVDKPKNVYSMEVVEKIKGILYNEIAFLRNKPPDLLKLGHGGILDYPASGVLVIGVGYGCKVLKKFLQCEKRYATVGKLGEETDTLNDIGCVTDSKPFDHVTKEQIDSLLKSKFSGKIWQTPPKYSALKKNGRRMSDLMMEGKEVEVSPRQVICHSVECTQFNPPFFELDVTCGGGFYIRSLVHDVAKEMGTCAHITELRRIQQGPFHESDALEKCDWTANCILEAMFKHRPHLRFQEAEVW